jgi:hypothetical protein
VPNDPATTPSTEVANGFVTGAQLLGVMVLQRVLGAVMIGGYRIRHTGSGLSRASRTDLLIDAMVPFGHGPTIRSVLTGENATF